MKTWCLWNCPNNKSSSSFGFRKWFLHILQSGTLSIDNKSMARPSLKPRPTDYRVEWGWPIYNDKFDDPPNVPNGHCKIYRSERVCCFTWKADQWCIFCFNSNLLYPICLKASYKRTSSECLVSTINCKSSHPWRLAYDQGVVVWLIEIDGLVFMKGYLVVGFLHCFQLFFSIRLLNW